MSAYTYIDSVPENYFSEDVEQSEIEANSTLRSHISASPILAESLRREVAQAMEDASYSWKKSMDEYAVFYFETEGEARKYAEGIWVALGLLPPEN